MCSFKLESEYAVQDKIFKNRMGYKLNVKKMDDVRRKRAEEFPDIDEYVCKRDINKEIAQLFL